MGNFFYMICYIVNRNCVYLMLNKYLKIYIHYNLAEFYINLIINIYNNNKLLHLNLFISN